MTLWGHSHFYHRPYAGAGVAHTLHAMTFDTPDDTPSPPPPARSGEGRVVAPTAEEQPLATSQLGSGSLAQQATGESPAAGGGAQGWPPLRTGDETAGPLL